MRRKSKKDLSEENKRLIKKLEESRREYSEMKRELIELAERLADLLSAKVEDCKLGVWCSECKYLREDRATSRSYRIDPVTGVWYACEDSAGNVRYCGKHFKDLCPEYEPKELEGS